MIRRRGKIVHKTAQAWLEHYATPVPESGCWLFNGYVDELGYGQITIGKGKGKIRLPAYRGSWIRFYGEIPAGMCVCHSCDVPSCINPKHLFLGTRAENNKDMFRKGRGNNQKKTLCMRGHELTALPYRKGRACLTCRNEKAKLWARMKRRLAKSESLSSFETAREG